MKTRILARAAHVSCKRAFLMHSYTHMQEPLRCHLIKALYTYPALWVRQAFAKGPAAVGVGRPRWRRPPVDAHVGEGRARCCPLLAGGFVCCRLGKGYTHTGGNVLSNSRQKRGACRGAWLPRRPNACCVDICQKTSSYYCIYTRCLLEGSPCARLLRITHTHTGLAIMQPRGHCLGASCCCSNYVIACLPACLPDCLHAACT